MQVSEQYGVWVMLGMTPAISTPQRILPHWPSVEEKVTFYRMMENSR